MIPLGKRVLIVLWNWKLLEIALEVVNNSDTWRRAKEIFGLFGDGECVCDQVGGHWCTLRLIWESSATPLLRCVRVFASHRETNRGVDAGLETRNVYF